MKICRTNILTVPTVSGTINGNPIDASQLFQASFQVTTVGGTAPSYTVKLQVSNDAPPASNNPTPTTNPPTNWADLPTATVSISGNGSLLIPKVDMCYSYVRAVLTYTSGNGAVVVKMFGTSV